MFTTSQTGLPSLIIMTMSLLSGLECTTEPSYRLPALDKSVIARHQHIWQVQEGYVCVCKDIVLAQESAILTKVPLEVRLIIWRYCLFVDVLHPFAKKRKDQAPHNESASVALLRVSRQIYAEADLVFLTNTFRFWSPDTLEQFLSTGLQSRSRRNRVQSIELSFQQVAMNKDSYLVLLHDANDRRIEEDMNGTLGDGTAGMAKQIHYLKKQAYKVDFWQPMTSLVLEHLKPRRLMIDLRFCHDEHKCCALQATALSTFRGGFRDGHVPILLRIRGCHGFMDSAEPGLHVADQLMLAMIQLWALRAAEPIVDANISTQVPLSVAQEGEKALAIESRMEQNRLGDDAWKFDFEAFTEDEDDTLDDEGSM